MHHFTVQEAKTQLLKEASEVLKPLKKSIRIEFLKKWENTVLLFFALADLLNFILSVLNLLKKGPQYGSLAQTILIVFGLGWNWYIYSW